VDLTSCGKAQYLGQVLGRTHLSAQSITKEGNPASVADVASPAVRMNLTPIDRYYDRRLPPVEDGIIQVGVVGLLSHDEVASIKTA
jgi:hypothetical protein